MIEAKTIADKLDKGEYTSDEEMNKFKNKKNLVVFISQTCINFYIKVYRFISIYFLFRDKLY